MKIFCWVINIIIIEVMSLTVCTQIGIPQMKATHNTQIVHAHFCIVILNRNVFAVFLAQDDNLNSFLLVV